MLMLGIGFFVGTFFGVLILSLMQMAKKGDKYEESIMEQRRANNKGVVCKPSDYSNHFSSDSSRIFCPICGTKFRKDGSTYHRLLYNEYGYLEL
jgi:hypothetical protein